MKRFVLFSFAITACEPIETFLPQDAFGGPRGVIEGSVSYSGPLPCTENGRIVGAAVLLAFNRNLLPPPDGLGTSAASMDIVTGETLFEGVRNQLTFTEDGSRWCSEDANVSVSASWSISPLDAGAYQIRGFYDLDGDFDPAFMISNLPSKGDIGGGAIDNASEVVLGENPEYREIELGQLQSDGSYVISDDGAYVSGVVATLGETLSLERPIFYAKSVIDDSGVNTDPNHVVMASDYTMESYTASNPSGTESSFIRMVLGAGVPENETDDGAASPLNFPLEDPQFLYTRQDVNGDSVLDEQDHVPDSEDIPSLYPLGIFSKLSSESKLVSQTEPTVILQGLTLYKSLLSTATSSPNLNASSTEVILALRPAVICINTANPNEPGVLLVTHETDASGNPIVSDETAVTEALSEQFNGRSFEVQYRCLPEGEYAINLIYDSGQAWTTPNEAAICADSETLSADGSTCGIRPRLASQEVTLTIGPPADSNYCTAHPAPSGCLIQ